MKAVILDASQIYVKVAQRLTIRNTGKGTESKGIDLFLPSSLTGVYFKDWFGILVPTLVEELGSNRRYSIIFRAPIKHNQSYVFEVGYDEYFPLTPKIGYNIPNMTQRTLDRVKIEWISECDLPIREVEPRPTHHLKNKIVWEFKDIKVNEQVSIYLTFDVDATKASRS
ncbi:MAG: hypothetical protein L6M37_06070 [Candidatus Methylarchaceae archaeon HK02M1]|nr:hypothetical protein [Candidatus Methylarchaceae archaeon HK02M1]